MQTHANWKLYITQGKALRDLLQKADNHGSHQKKIKEIEKKLKKAQGQLKKSSP